MLLNSDDARYGGRGGGPGNGTWLWSGQARQDCSDSVTLDIPSHSCLLLLAPEKFNDFKASRPPGGMDNGHDLEYCLADIGY